MFSITTYRTLPIPEFIYLNSKQAWFGGKEYVITQLIDNIAEEVETVLTKKYKLLCLGNAVKAAFNDHALQLGAKTIPCKPSGHKLSECKSHSDT